MTRSVLPSLKFKKNAPTFDIPEDNSEEIDSYEGRKITETEMKLQHHLHFLSLSQKRGVAGICACLLPFVQDGSNERTWSKTYLQMLIEKLLNLPETQVQAFLPILTAHQNALSDYATSSGDEFHRTSAPQPIDPAPFIELLVPEEKDPQHQEENIQDQVDQQDQQMTTIITTEQPLDEFRWEIVRTLLWFTVKLIGYDARARVLLNQLAHRLQVPWKRVTQEEIKIGRVLFAEATGMPVNEKIPQKWNLWDWKRNATIGAAAVTGGALLAITGGLAAPAIAASLSALGGAGVAIGTVVGSTAGVTATTVLFGTAGAGVVGMKADNRTRGVADFNFDLITSGDGLNVYVCVTGWIDEEDPVVAGYRLPWGDSREYLRAFYRRENPEKVDQVESVLDRYKGREDNFFDILKSTYNINKDTKDPLGLGLLPSEEKLTFLTDKEQDELRRAWRWKDRFPQGDQYCIQWEEELLRKFGKSMRSFATQQVINYANNEIIQLTAFAALFAAVAIPRAVMRMADMIDGVWVLVMARADEAGKILAEALSRREQGLRPVTLVGYSMGARLIFSCLKELAAKGESCCGIVEHAVLLGTPVPVALDEWKNIRKVVAGRLINGYSENDWMLAIMYRYQGWSLDSAGIGPVGVLGVENVNLSSIIGGHLEYKNKMASVLDYLQLEQ